MFSISVLPNKISNRFALLVFGRDGVESILWAFCLLLKDSHLNVCAGILLKRNAFKSYTIFSAPFNNESEVYKIHFCPKKMHEVNTAEGTLVGGEEVENSHPVGVGVPANFQRAISSEVFDACLAQISGNTLEISCDITEDIYSIKESQ